MTRISMVLVVLFGLTATAAAQNIGGRYQVQGTNPNGSTYSGTAIITLTSRTTCRIEWRVGNSSRGICMRNGDMFSAAYVLGGKTGLVIYRIRGDGSMEGLWTVADEDGVGSERLIPN